MTSLLAIAACQFPPTLSAQPGGDRIDPRRSDFGTFKVVDEWDPVDRFTLGPLVFPLQDLDGDGLNEWLTVEHDRDTIYASPIQRHAQYLRLNFGSRDGFPAEGSGYIISPSEHASGTYFLTSGDFDGDGFLDLFCRIDIYWDTVVVPGVSRNYLGRPTIFWGNAEGRYSIDDTTRLRGGQVVDYRFLEAGTWDRNSDGIDDLWVAFSGDLYDSTGVEVPTPRLHIWLGRPRSDWNHPDSSRRADFFWWNPPTGLPRNRGVDVDCDGYSDLVFHGDSTGIGWHGELSVLYGRPPNEELDTNDVVTVELTGVLGKSTKLIDVTNDHVLDLVILCGRFSSQSIRVYPGEPGKRLHELITDDPIDSLPEAITWREPWANIVGPRVLHDGWGDLGNEIFDGGDMNGDGYRDLWFESQPFIVAYGTNLWLDSMIDGLIQISTTFTQRGIVDIGLVDGSGYTTTAIDLSDVNRDRSILYVQGHDRMPYVGRLRWFPHDRDVIRCDSPASVNDGSESDSSRLRLDLARQDQQ